MSVSPNLQSGFARHRSQAETVVLIVCFESPAVGLSGNILERPKTTTLAPGGHEPQGSLSSLEIDPHVSAPLSEADIAKLRFAEAQNVHA